MPTVARDLASVLISLGVVTFVYEYLLRASLTNEILQRVGLQQRLVDTGITQIATESDIQWREYLAESRSFFVLLVDPSPTLTRLWALVLEASRDRAVQVVICLPNRASTGFGSMAERLGLTPDQLSDRIDSARRQIEDGWGNAKDAAPRIVRGSSLQIRYFDSAASYEVVRSDGFAVLMLPRAIAAAADAGPAVFVLERRSNRFPHTWLDEQVRLASSSPTSIVFENVVR